MTSALNVEKRFGGTVGGTVGEPCSSCEGADDCPSTVAVDTRGMTGAVTIFLRARFFQGFAAFFLRGGNVEYFSRGVLRIRD